MSISEILGEFSIIFCFVSEQNKLKKKNQNLKKNSDMKMRLRKKILYFDGSTRSCVWPNKSL